MFRYWYLLIVCLLYGFSISGTTPYQFPDLQFFPTMPVATDNPVTNEGATLGRYLFYDPILSRDSTIACASCHRQEAAFSGSPDAFSKGINGVLQKRNTLPLFNLAWNTSFFWDGRVKSLEEQVFQPVKAHDEMNLDWGSAVTRISRNKFYRSRFNAAFPQGKIDSILIAKAIAQFERTLLSYRSKYDMVLANKASFTKDEAEGFEIINEMTMGDCLHCHTTDSDPLGSTGHFSNNGLDAAQSHEDYIDYGLGGITGKKEDYGKFKIPSLRNLSFTAPYMHDGRFKTLDEVLDFYSEHVNDGINTDSKMSFANRGGAHLTKEQKKKVIAFLMSLDDSLFINDKSFSNPFTQQ